jgi:adenine deaminase
VSISREAATRGIDAAKFISDMPKAELHLHIEGTVEPERLLSLAAKNGIDIPYTTLGEVLAAQDYGPSGEAGLNNFLDYLTECKRVLCTTVDFHETTYEFLRRCAAENIRYVEIMFDPQSHLGRGIAFAEFFEGLQSGIQKGLHDFAVESELIMCLHRDKSADYAMQVLDMALPFRDDIIGLGLDNYELDDFPENFKDVFKRGAEEGYRLTSHCDCDLGRSTIHIRGCIELLGVERIDHGVNCLDEVALLEAIKARNISLTMCPTWRVGDTKPRRIGRIKQLLDEGVLVSVNTDDPSLFASGYLTSLMIGVHATGELSLTEMVQLMENAFRSSWLTEAKKLQYIDDLNQYAVLNGVR